MFTTGSYVLSLHPEEKSELGTALHETLQNFPAASPVVRVVNFVAPWGALIDGLGKAFFKRFRWLSDRKRIEQQRYEEPPGPANEMRVDNEEIVLPEPVTFSQRT